MFEFDKKVAQEVCMGDLSLNPRKWFEEEIDDLASRFPGLDGMDKSAVMPLAQLSANGALSEHALARATGLDLTTVEACLQALGDRSLVQTCANGYEATDEGKAVFRAAGTKLIIRRRFEMKSRFEHLDRIYKAISAAWHK